MSPNLYGEGVGPEPWERWCDVCRHAPHEVTVPWGLRGRARVCGPCEAMLAEMHEAKTHDCKRWGCS